MSTATTGGTSTEFAPNLLGTFRTIISGLDSAIDNVQQTWNMVIAKVNQLIEACVKKLNDENWFSQVVDYFSKKVENALIKIKQIVNSISTIVNQVLTKGRDVLTHSVPVMSLFETGLDWSSKIKKPVSLINADLDDEVSDIDNWRGPAHDTYVERAAAQEKALDSSTEKAGDLSSWLSKVANANINYVKELVDLALELIAKFTETGTNVGIAAGTADVLSAQQAVNDASETAGKVVEALLKAATTLASHFGEVVDEINDLANTYYDFSAFPGEKWPKTVKSA